MELSLLAVTTGSALAADPLPDINVYGVAGLLKLPRAAPIGRGHFAFGAWVNFYRGGGINALRAAPVSVGFGLPARLDLSISFADRDRGDPEARDARTHLRVAIKRLLTNKPLNIAVALRGERLLSPPDLTPMLLADKVIGRSLVLAAAAGFRFATDSDSEMAAILGAGAQLRLTDWLQMQAELNATQGRHSPFELDASGAFQFRVVGALGIVVAVTAGVVGRHDMRVSFGVRIRPALTDKDDSDEDGLPDIHDKCPDEPEDKDGFLDADGCPDPDNDGDGIPDKLDATPNGTGSTGIHRGPARLRMRIPIAPIPKWIMRSSTRRDQGQVAPRLGTGVGLSVEVVLPKWASPTER